jgi:hypothetical protein
MLRGVSVFVLFGVCVDLTSGSLIYDRGFHRWPLQEAKEPSLPGLAIFNEKIKRPTRQDHDDASFSLRHEVNEEVMIFMVFHCFS